MGVVGIYDVRFIPMCEMFRDGVCRDRINDFQLLLAQKFLSLF